MSARSRVYATSQGFPVVFPAFLTPGADVAAWESADTLERVNPRV
jgi:hypothetical protein